MTKETDATTPVFTARYASPLGSILLAADEIGLIGLWFEGAKYFAAGLPNEHAERETPVLGEAARWLDQYFGGEEPGFTPALHPRGSAFRRAVWDVLLRIPYSTTTTYGAIARELARRQGTARVSAQAVGGAVGHNPISLIVPCHRVVGATGSLTGYAGGVEKKLRLLKLEGVDTRRLTVPTRGTAL